MSTYDPVTTATSLAESYIYTRQYQLDTASNKVNSQVSALTSLKSSLTAFSTSLTSLSAKGSLVAQTATVSNAAAATASVSANAAAGTYSFEVERLASAQQSLYSASDLGIQDGTQQADGSVQWPVQPQVVVSLGDGGFFAVNLSNADADNDGKLSVTEIARAINTSSEGKVSAAVISSGGEQQLLLNSSSTGEKNAFAVHVLSRNSTDEMSTGDIQNYLNAYQEASVKVPAEQASGGHVIAADKVLTQAQDAIVWVGGKTSGLKTTSATNTYTGIDGLTISLKAETSSAFTVTVAKDESTTQSNMQKLVDAYNTAVNAIDKLTASGNTESGVAAGALANDSSIRSLRTQLSNLLRASVDGVSLTDFGISANRDGTISLDSGRFAKKVASNPDALTTLLGQTNSLEYKRGGVLGSLQTYVETWTKSSGGLLQSRQDSLTKQQAQFTKQQTTIDTMYESAYQRYLTQFTALASLEDQMSSTTNLLTAMFSSDDD